MRIISTTMVEITAGDHIEAVRLSNELQGIRHALRRNRATSHNAYLAKRLACVVEALQDINVRYAI